MNNTILLSEYMLQFFTDVIQGWLKGQTGYVTSTLRSNSGFTDLSKGKYVSILSLTTLHSRSVHLICTNLPSQNPNF